MATRCGAPGRDERGARPERRGVRKEGRGGTPAPRERDGWREDVREARPKAQEGEPPCREPRWKEESSPG